MRPRCKPPEETVRRCRKPGATFDFAAKQVSGPYPRSEAAMWERCLDRVSGGTSGIKDIAAKMVAFGQGLSGLFVDDEVVKGSLASYTFEQMEIASYKILIAAAEHVGDQETKRVCEIILQQEVAMAQWLDEHAAAITRKFLERDQQGLAAKH
ncbi:MAG: DUF892 family protein [Sinorhizobium meliloti]|nr:DUF892 family protein [Sinorhizobium meliloti]